MNSAFICSYCANSHLALETDEMYLLRSASTCSADASFPGTLYRKGERFENSHLIIFS
jgi:hypothetical protein